MGLAYYRVSEETYTTLLGLIQGHETQVVGPRARGYWFDAPDDFDYEAVQAEARALDQGAKAAAFDALEIGEVEAHALSQLDVSLPQDDAPMAPILFMCSADPEAVRLHLRYARKALGPDAERALSRVGPGQRDARMFAYISRQIAHMRNTLPRVWAFYERCAAFNHAVIVVDLRARDLFIPDPVERAEILDAD